MLLSFLFSLLLAEVVLLFNSFNLVSKISDQLDEEWHSPFVKVESPGQFEDEVGAEELIASVETGSEEFLFVVFNEELQEVFNKLRVSTFLGSLNTILQIRLKISFSLLCIVCLAWREQWIVGISCFFCKDKQKFF
mgnify:FL=1